MPSPLVSILLEFSVSFPHALSEMHAENLEVLKKKRFLPLPQVVEELKAATGTKTIEFE